MKKEHEDRLGELSERLADVFIEEADPDLWAGGSAKPAERTKEDRGNRNWDLKNANALGLLLARALELRQRARWVREADAGINEPAPDHGTLSNVRDPDEEIHRFEREALKCLAAVGARREAK